MLNYNHNGLLVIDFPVANLRLLYWDKPKMSAMFMNCFNAGFFAPYAERVDGIKRNFTMPVANLCVDTGSNVPELGQKYINEWTHGTGLSRGQVKLSCTQNGEADFKRKPVATLIINNAGKAYVQDVDVLPDDCRYAVSGVPCIRNSNDVDWKYYVKPQGWRDDVMRPAYRNWLGIKGNQMFLISGRTYKGNYIYGMEFWKKMRDIGMTDCIGLDGGGSYFLRLNGKTVKRTAENRQINSIGVIV